ncbi:MAG: rod shape-determining protein RodA [Gaiellaceae bacterium]
MLEYAGSHRAGLRQREAPHLLAVVRSLDWILLVSVAALVVVGLWGVAGVTKFAVPNDPTYYLNRQILYAVVGSVVLVAAALVDPDIYRRYWRIIFGGTAGLIAIVFLAGHAANGSTRWISLGFFTFQPSEFGKLLVVLALAGLIAERQRSVGEWGTTLKVIAFGAVPVVLVFIQPDLGTALVYLAALAAMLFVAGAPWRHLATLATIAVLLIVGVLWVGPGVGVNFLKGYQQQRLTCFTHPTTCPVAQRYNLEQSKAAIGSGQIRGRGPNGATQVRFSFLPASDTDFVFAGYAEQRGFVGAVILLALYLLVLWRGLRVVTVARDLFSAVVAGGIVAALLFQMFVNVGMTMGIAPITGIPLPFVSVGGSSMISNLAAMGVLLAIHARGRASRRRR